MNELDALLIVSENNGKSMSEMLTIARQKGFSNDLENKLRFQSLYEQDFITGVFVLGLPVNITLAGKDHLAELQQKTADRTEKKRQTRLQNQLSVTSILVNLVVFIGGLVVEHYAGLVSFFLNLFR